MAFTRVQVGMGGRRAKDTVRVARYATKDVLIVNIPADIHAELGSPAHLALSIGTGSDRGWILLTPVDARHDGYAVWRAPRSPSFRCTLPSSQLGLAAAFSTTPAEFKVTEDGLLVVLPAAALASPSVSKPKHVNGAAVEAAA